MPEGPEIYYFALQIYNLFNHHYLTDVNILSGKYSKIKSGFKNYNLLKSLLPIKILSVSTLGKIILLELEQNYFLILTFGMTGFMTTDNIKHNHIEFIISNKDNKLRSDTSIFYNDMRNFGNIYLLDSETTINKIKTIGPDILDPNFTYKLFKLRIKQYIETYPSAIYKPICVILLDQNFVSGIGNYLRSEILYHAKINPFEKFVKFINIDNNLKQIKNLYKCIYNVSRYYFNVLIKSENLINSTHNLKLSKEIKQNFKFKLKHKPESYGRVYMVYGEKIAINGKKIKRKKINGRSIYYI
jgi:formamidopyrimidine-DNA glycosylase